MDSKNPVHCGVFFIFVSGILIKQISDYHLNKFKMTTGELFLIFLAIFILFGPQKIPEIAKKLAKGIQKIKIAAEDITEEVNKTVNPIKEELKAQADKLKEELDIKNTEKAIETKTDTNFSNQGKNLIG